MIKAESNRSYALANTQPVTNRDDLQVWWYRDTVSTRYYAYKVKRVRLEPGEDNMLFLHFKLARREDLPDFKVEMTRQTAQVWPDLPSTIQLAKQDGLYGFLMLSANWEMAAQSELARIPEFSTVNITDLREGGEKWPIAAKPASAVLKTLWESAGLPPVLEKIFLTNR